jgi:hypothetical protein
VSIEIRENPMTRVLTKTLILSFAGLCQQAFADDETGLSDAQTSYTGATMLIGSEDVVFNGVEVGSTATAEDLTTYGYFAGNTLYAGTMDPDGNAVDAIVEFFWFESSVDRGSDFYVGIVKARTTPSEGFGLDHCDGWSFCDGPAVAVYTDSDTSSGNGAFRWDWSLPFDDYGIDAVGEVTLTNSYGIGSSAEGSALYSETYDEDGNKVEGNIQAKGYVSTAYKVQTQYQVTLYEWDVEVEGNNSKMDWEVILNTGMSQEENAYHEFFVVMQVEEGETFTIDNLEIAGTVDGGWFDGGKVLSVNIDDIALSQPEFDEDSDDSDDSDDDDNDWGDTGSWDWDDSDDEDDSDDFDWSDDDEETNTDLTDLAGSGDEEGQEIEVSLFGCSSLPSAHRGSGLALFAGLLGLLGLRRRR